jgi:hypothetical protein
MCRQARVWSASLMILAAVAILPAPARGQDPAQAEQQEQTPPQPGQLQQPSQPGEQLPDTVSAPPFTVRDKFDYRVVQTFGLRGVVGAAISASIGQALDSPHEWGEGTRGYAERFGSSLGSNLSRQTFAWVLESSFHEDPRYFPSEDKGFKSRMVNVAKQVFICKTDSGRSEFAYARVISAFGAGEFTNVWQPASASSAADGLKRGFITLGADTAYNFFQEFFPFTRPVSLRHRH